MILIDVNLLLYALNQQAPQHKAARRWLESSLSGGEGVGLPWLVLLSFVRLSTKPGLFASPLSVRDALDEVETWLGMRAVSVPQPGPRHVQILRGLLLHAGTAGNLTTDAHLAALALEYGAEVCTADRDFARFPGVRWRNPLREAGSR